MTKVTATQKIDTHKMEMAFELEKISLGIEDMKEKQEEMFNDTEESDDEISKKTGTDNV